MKGTNRLKRSLIYQSFCPLFVLLIIKYLDIKGIQDFGGALSLAADKSKLIINDLFCSEKSITITIVLILTSLIIVIKGVITFFQFEEMWKSNTTDNGEIVVIEGYESDVGISFFVSYILPLMMDNLNTVRGLTVFIVMMVMITILLNNSNLYYQNPVLSAMGYKVFRFSFVETMDTSLKNRLFYGLTKGDKIDTNRPVKRRILGDDIVLIFGK